MPSLESLNTSIRRLVIGQRPLAADRSPTPPLYGARTRREWPASCPAQGRRSHGRACAPISSGATASRFRWSCLDACGHGVQVAASIVDLLQPPRCARLPIPYRNLDLGRLAVAFEDDVERPVRIAMRTDASDTRGELFRSHRDRRLTG